MKKIIQILLFASIIFYLFQIEVNADSDKGYFIVTAYYSPLPDQEKYLTGDYESEKRLNGQGIRGASGKEVFSGMLAAPKNYTFGTKIYLEGLGIGSVEDRGGAIVNAGNRGYNYDRIDVWVGYGDEGLRRALYWGKRKVKGYFVSDNSNITLDYSDLPAPTWATKGLNKIPNIFSKGLGKGSNSENVKKLQELLKEAGLYNGDINGIYNSQVISIIYDFQISNKLIEQGEYYGAGYWGKTTRDLFLKKYLNGEFNNDDLVEEEKNEDVVQEIIKAENNLSVFDSAANDPEKIKNLQIVLKELGLYNGEINGIYKTIIDPIYDYQISEGIVSSIYSPGAGNFGPKTRASLKETYNKYLLKKEEEALLRRREEEKRKEAELRKKELEEKYKNLEKLSLKKAEEIINFIGSPKYGDVSHSVRELQKILNQLGYFDYKDTAIYGKITKQSIIAYQLGNNIITKKTDIGAGIIGPETKKFLKNDLKQKFLSEIIAKEKINKNELVLIIKGES